MPELHALFFDGDVGADMGSEIAASCALETKQELSNDSQSTHHANKSHDNKYQADRLTPDMMCKGLRRLGHELTPTETETLACTLGWQKDPPASQQQGIAWRDFAVALLGWSAPARQTFIRSFYDKLNSEGRGGISRGSSCFMFGEECSRLGL